jgi:hypothetical protein
MMFTRAALAATMLVAGTTCYADWRGLSLLLIGQSSGRTFYVATNGSDATGTPGTLASPFRTIQRGLNAANLPGDTVYVRSGTYKPSSQIRFNNNGSASGGHITLAKYPPDTTKPIIDAVNFPWQQSCIVNMSGRNYVTLDGFVLRNLKKVAVSGSGVQVLGVASNVRIRNNVIRDLEPGPRPTSWPASRDYQPECRGIAVMSSQNRLMTNIEITGNEIFGVKTGFSGVVEICGKIDGYLIENNIIRDNDTNPAIVIYFAIDPQLFYQFADMQFETIDSVGAKNGTIRLNSIYNHDGAFGGCGIYVAGGDDTLIERNHIYNNQFGITLAGEQVGVNSNRITIQSNIIENNKHSGISIGGSANDQPAFPGLIVDTTIRSNTLYNNGGGWWYGTSQGSLTMGNNQGTYIFGNIFVAASDGEFANQVLNVRDGNNSFTGLTMDTNLYWTVSGGAPTFEWPANTLRTGLLAWKTASGLDTYSIQASPLFVSATTGNYRLQAGSPARDASASYPGLFAPTDYEGRARPVGPNPDIGAFEFPTAP